MSQSYCLNAHAKCDFEQASKQVLKIWNLGRVTREKECETKIDKLVQSSSKSHRIFTKISLSSQNDSHVPTLVLRTLRGNKVLNQDKGQNKKYLQNLY